MRHFPTNFLSRRSRRPICVDHTKNLLLGVTSKKRSSCVILIWEKRSQTLGANFAQIFGDFRQIKTFGVALAPPAPLTQVKSLFEKSRRLSVKQLVSKYKRDREAGNLWIGLWMSAMKQSYGSKKNTWQFDLQSWHSATNEWKSTSSTCYSSDAPLSFKKTWLS